MADDNHGLHSLWRRVHASDPMAMLELVRLHVAGADIAPERPEDRHREALRLCDRLRDVLHGMLLARKVGGHG